MSGDCLSIALMTAQESAREAEVGVGVADLADRLARDVLDVDVGRRRDLARHDDEAGVHERLAGHAPVRVVAQDGVEHAVGDLVGDLVGMALGDGLRGEQVLVVGVLAHGIWRNSSAVVSVVRAGSWATVSARRLARGRGRRAPCRGRGSPSGRSARRGRGAGAGRGRVASRPVRRPRRSSRRTQVRRPPSRRGGASPAGAVESTRPSGGDRVGRAQLGRDAQREAAQRADRARPEAGHAAGLREQRGERLLQPGERRLASVRRPPYCAFSVTTGAPPLGRPGPRAVVTAARPRPRSGAIRSRSRSTPACRRDRRPRRRARRAAEAAEHPHEPRRPRTPR